MSKKGKSPQALKDLAYILARTEKDPLLFVQAAFSWGQNELKEHGILDWQKEVLVNIREGIINLSEAVQIAVSSGHGIGKSALVSWLILWAISTKANTKGVITANTEHQLKSKTWAELAKWHRLSIVEDMFEVSKTAIFSTDARYEKTWRIDAIPWSEHRPEAFAGLHNQGGRILIIFDEASAIPDCIWEVAEGAMTDKNTEIFFLCFGNPTRSSGRFYECFGRFRHRWITKKIDSRTVPITDKRQLNKWVSDYGIDSDFVKIRVLGEFPSGANASLISRESINCAVERMLNESVYQSSPRIIGVDVARFGEDKTVIARRQGLKLYDLKKYSNLDTMEVADAVIREISSFKPEAVFIDLGGVGAGVYDRLKWLNYNVIGVDFAGKPNRKDKYINKRAEMWGEMAEWLKSADIPNDTDLKEDLAGPQYYFRGDNAQILLEKKQDMKKRGLASPDCADALALTFAAKVNENKRELPSKILR